MGASRKAKLRCARCRYHRDRELFISPETGMVRRTCQPCIEQRQRENAPPSPLLSQHFKLSNLCDPWLRRPLL